ncbi:hypothetical protein COJ96_02310 [Bacillus sp. AFS073361]|uniref:magnesium transporter MgtE N-terminal domain-containing protein n=1 Tax=Bacillus sp. AFS073361 TaxID=2033511 RepID=UPI000BF287D8|nr:hypothetical protein [Bacillus sp. AFS073361]PFP30818.1 hypothetical protein COJ96_02310 [Bacillus sp. AFS073361]
MSTADTKTATEDNDQKRPGFFSKILLLGVLPFLYTIGLGIMILHFAGVNMITQVKWIEEHTKPLFAKKEAPVKPATSPKGQAQSAKSNTNAGSSPNKSESVKEQSKPNTDKRASITKQNNAVDGSSSTTEQSQNTPTVAETLASMDPSSAAKLLSNMNEADALRNLKRLEPDAQTLIIAEMPAEAGARLTVALANGNDIPTTTDSSVQLFENMKPDQIAAVLKGIKNNAEVLRQIKKLDPITASKVISQLDPVVAGWIVTRMN